VKKGIIFSAMQPTGRLHLGNLEGALRNWVSLQDEYEMYCGIVDLHALTTVYEDPSSLEDFVLNLAIDYVSAGIDPEKTPIVVQSYVPEHTELHLLLSMITPVGWLERVPTYKEKIRELKISSASYGLLGYPVLQAADIMIYRADTVPVGKDQLPHLELTREIARRFNSLYGEVFPEPQAKVNECGIFPGVDGRKMSKSYGNTILMADEPEAIRRKVNAMFTDPTKVYKADPGHPDQCPVWFYQRMYNPDEAEEIACGCRAGGMGCVADKKKLAEKMIEALAPIRERRRELEQDPQLIREILAQGAERAKRVTRETMAAVREAMKMAY
jgi:tryptophanyl-tRNA synthetase